MFPNPLTFLFDTQGFSPRWHCGDWSAAHGWTHILADVAIFGAYAAIPLSILYFLRKRRDVQLPTLWWLFAAFIFSCGFTHLVEASLFWEPWYHFSGLMKVITALVSWATVIAIYRSQPSLVNLPNLAQLNARLRRSEQKLEVTLNSIGDAMMATDAEGRVTRMNPVAEALTGWTQEEARTHPVMEVFQVRGVDARQDPAFEIRDVLERGLTIGQTHDCVLTARHGAETLVAKSAAPIRDGEATILGAVIIFRDVAKEREQAQAARHRAEQSLRYHTALLEMRKHEGDDRRAFWRLVTEQVTAALDVARVGLWFFEEQREEIVCEDMFLRSRAEHMRGQRLRAVDYPAYFQALEPGLPLAIRDARQDPATREFSSAYLEPSGITSLLDVPIRREGALVGVICCEETRELRTWQLEEEEFLAATAGILEIALENSRRRDAEEEVRRLNQNLECLVAERTAELNEQKELISRLLENLNDGVVACDAQGRLTFFNRVARDWHGCDIPPDPAEQWSEKLNLCHEDGKTPLSVDEIPLIRALAGERVRDAGMAISAPGQPMRIVVAAADPLLGPDGENHGAVVVMHDVTIERRRERDLAEALETQKELTRSAKAGERAKSEFLAMMSHEIRTPMNGILGFAELLDHSPALSSEDRNCVQTIMSSGQSLLRILDDVLDFSRLEAGRLEMTAEDFSPADLAREMRDFFEPAAREKGLALQLSCDPTLPTLMRGDAGRVRQILVNLLSNAVKFTAAGSIHLQVAVPTPATISFSVEDTGQGISRHDLEQIFLPFRQGDSTLARPHGGTGLGLAISRRLARLLGGDLTVSSALQQGSTFTLRLPMCVAQAPKTPSEPIENPSALDPSFASRHPMRVLVVEDDPINLKLTVHLLRKLGYQPATARDGEEATELFRREEIHFIIMDLQMPQLDGIGATRQIREQEASSPGGRRVFISALTANIIPEDRDRCFTAGMDAFLNKPFRLPELKEILIAAYTRTHLS